LPDKDVLDLTRLQEAFEDDTAGIAELLEMALETGKKHCAALEAAIAAGDAPAVAKAAHGIKGSSGNIGANRVMEIAARVDARARTGDLTDAREEYAAIVAGYARVADEVRAYRESLT
jgi:two-component system sensor histidine kinase BarA